MRLFILASVLFSAQAFANCPDLSSTTSFCRSTTGQISGNENQVIAQETTDGVTTYFFTSEKDGESTTTTYIADGKSRREMIVDPDTGITLLNATTVTCKEGALLEHTTSFLDGQFLGVMDVTTTKSDEVVIRVFAGLRWGRDVDDTIVCK